MKRHHDTPATNRRAMRGGGALVAGGAFQLAGAMFQVGLLRNPGAMIRALYVSG